MAVQGERGERGEERRERGGGSNNDFCPLEKITGCCCCCCCCRRCVAAAAGSYPHHRHRHRSGRGAVYVFGGTALEWRGEERGVTMSYTHTAAIKRERGEYRENVHVQGLPKIHRFFSFRQNLRHDVPRPGIDISMSPFLRPLLRLHM